MGNTTSGTRVASWVTLSFACAALACGASPPPAAEATKAGAGAGVSMDQSQRPQVQAEGAEAAYDSAAAAPRAEAPSPPSSPLSASGGPGNMGVGVVQPVDLGKAQVQPGTTSQPGGQTRPPLATVIRPTGIPVCDDYLTALQKCVMQLPAPQRASMEESIRHIAGAFATGAQQADARPKMEASCRQEHEQIKTSCFKR